MLPTLTPAPEVAKYPGEKLIEARRLILSDGVTSSSAAFAVGYESVSQFTREYARMFGLPPVRETKAARGNAQAA